MNDDDPQPANDEPESSSAPDSWVRRLGKSLAGPPRSAEELREILHEARGDGILGADELWMIEGVLEVSETQVRDIMIPRGQMVVVSRDAEPNEILTTVVESGHSRFPVIGESRDEVVGLLLAKDLLRFMRDNERLGFDRNRFNLGGVLRSATFVPESKRLNVLLKEFRSKRNHMAIVVDEYGGVAGLITIEDVIEQIVGEIDDEYDQDDGAFILRQDSGRYLVRALTPIDEFNQQFGTGFSDEEFDTIGGLVTHEFGHMPKRGESVALGRFQFSVQRADSRRIELFQVTVLPNANGGSS